MSCICDAVILSTHNDQEALDALNATLADVDFVHHQRFERIDMDGAGGTKFYVGYVYAGAFNHLLPSKIEEAVASAPWSDPDHTAFWMDAYDYDEDPIVRTITQLRAVA